MGLFQSASSLTFRNTVEDKAGYIQALLNDIGNEGAGIDYDAWISLVPILKYEIDDEDLAFEIFDTFSSQNEFYDEDFTYTKWHDAGLEADGRLTMGSLVYMAKEELGEKFDSSRYSQFFGKESVSKVEQFNLKIKKNKNKLPDHYLLEGIEDLKFPMDASVSHEIALTTVLMEGYTYGTATDPRQCKVVDPFAGDRLEQYITVNPVKDSRKQDNVLAFRYAVLEFDTIHLDEQFSILSSVELPYEALVFTGNKSIHAWIRIDAKDIAEYKKRTRLIAKMLSDFGYNKENGNGPDTAVLFDCASLVRCPGAKRVDWSNKGDTSAGTMQRAIWTEESEGWDQWYKTVYPKYVVESSLSDDVEEEQSFEVPDKDHNFARHMKKVVEQKGEDFAKPLEEGLRDTPHDEIPKALMEAIPEFFIEYTKNNRKAVPLTKETLYHLFIDACREGGAHYEGDIQEVLWNSCVNAHRFVENEFKQKKARLLESIESLRSIDFEDSDPNLLHKIDSQLVKASNSEKPSDLEDLELSLDQTAADMAFRPAVFQSSEPHKWAGIFGRLLSGEFKNIGHKDHGVVYQYYGKPQYFDSEEGLLKPVMSKNFPFIIAPYVCFVKQSAKGNFSVVPLDNDNASKIAESHQFCRELRKVEIISEVPIFKELENGAELIVEYDHDKHALITGDPSGYEFMDLQESVGLLIGLFDDFEFVDKSDLSRAIAALMTPAMTHADLLEGDFRPICYIDADSQGAGKNTLADFLTIPYVKNPAKVTQDDTSIGSIDDKLGSAILAGEDLIILDNLKPTRKMKELSSPFIESLTTSNTIKFRPPGQQNVTLKTDNTCLYVTTNGMSLSRDLAQRSTFLSIRKKPEGYSFKKYQGGHASWIFENRNKIMSAIFSVMKEYVERGKPKQTLKESHRFLYSTPILNYIVVNIFDLPDISTGTRARSANKSKVGMDLIRAICFCIKANDLLGQELYNLDIFELLVEAGQEDLVGLEVDDVYSDEDGTILTADAKRAIGQKFSKILSHSSLLGKAGAKKEPSSCIVEEFLITRSYNSSNKSAKYKVELHDKNDT